jgi:flagella basal body P-ring formation protein FlgA
VVTTDTTPTLVGTGTPGDIITVRNASGDVIGTGIVDGSGNWSIIPLT